MAKVSLDITVRVEKALHDVFREVAMNSLEQHGIKIEKVIFQWGYLPESKKSILTSVKIISRG